jgi:hypothetical protein
VTTIGRRPASAIQAMVAPQESTASSGCGETKIGRPGRAAIYDHHWPAIGRMSSSPYALGRYSSKSLSWRSMVASPPATGITTPVR